MDNPSGSDTYLEQNKGIGWFVSQELVTFDQDFLKIFSSKPSNTVVLIMRMKRRRPFVSLTRWRWFGGFTVDLYGEFVVFSWYNPFVFQIKETILAAFQEAFSEVRGGYEKIRFKRLGL